MKRLNEISDIIMGQSPASSTYNTIGEGVPFFQGNADFGIEHPNVRVYCSLPTKMSEKGDVLISVRAPIGAVNIANQRCCIGRGLAAVRPLEGKSQTRYLYHLLIANKEVLESKGTGSTFKAITGKVLNDVHVPSYNMEQQKEIARVLDTVVAAITKRRKQIDFYNDLEKSQFIEMFGDLRNNPKGWNFIPLGKVCDVRDGTHDSPKYCSKGYPLLTSKNFTDGGVDFKGANFISEKDYFAINQRSKVDVGDIVMPMIGTIGHPVIIDTQKPFAIKNVALIKFAKSNFLNVFIRAILDSDYFSAIITSKNRGNTQKFIALGDIRAIEIPQVPYEIQKQFSHFVEQTDKSKFRIKQSLEKLETLYKALLQKYFG